MKRGDALNILYETTTVHELVPPTRPRPNVDKSTVKPQSSDDI